MSKQIKYTKGKQSQFLFRETLVGYVEAVKMENKKIKVELDEYQVNAILEGLDLKMKEAQNKNLHPVIKEDLIELHNQVIGWTQRF